MKLAGGALQEALGPFAPLNGAAFNTFTTKQSVSPLPIPKILAGRLDLGGILEVEAEGEWSCVITANPSLTLGLFLGTHDGTATAPVIVTDIALSAAQSCGAAALTGMPWRMEFRGKCIKVGASGQIQGGGALYFGTSLTAFTISPIPITQALRNIAINTTVENAIGVSATWSASNAANSVTTYFVNAEIKN